LDNAFVAPPPPKTLYCQDIEKWLHSNPGRVVTVYQFGEIFENAYKEAATGATAADGFRVTSRSPCDQNIFRPQDFPLATGNTGSVPVNHSALVKTSDQPSFSSSNFAPLISVEVLRASVISPVPSLNLKPNPRGGTAKKVKSSPFKIFVEAIQKEKIKKATKSKT
jgi:hypothetical protein